MNTRISIPRRPQQKRRWLHCLPPLVLLLSIPFFSTLAVAQENGELKDFKEQLKQEILQELRGETGTDTQSQSDFLSLKEEIKAEILRELRKDLLKPQETRDEVKQELKLELRQELLGDIKKQIADDGPILSLANENTGAAEGYILRHGRGLAGCRVKLVQLSGQSTQFQDFSEGKEYEVVTKDDGNYVFAGIPAGNYRLKWELPGDSGWIRRLRDKPDVAIRPGSSSPLKTIETSRGLVPR